MKAYNQNFLLAFSLSLSFSLTHTHRWEPISQPRGEGGGGKKKASHWSTVPCWGKYRDWRPTLWTWQMFLFVFHRCCRYIHALQSALRKAGLHGNHAHLHFWNWAPFGWTLFHPVSCISVSRLQVSSHLEHWACYTGPNLPKLPGYTKDDSLPLSHFSLWSLK